MSARHALEHRLWKILGELGVREKTVLLACSGGADSMALARAFAAIFSKDRLAIAHFHHGSGDQTGFRDESEFFMKTFAEASGIRFLSRRHFGEPLKSENDFRRARRRALEEMRIEAGADLIATAHHADDVLETRLIRLIRGTGPDGLQAISPLRGVWLRPLLTVSGGELRSYLADLSQDHVEDPSNRDPRFLRNWLRHRWLPSLEKRRPGAAAAMARSLEDVSAAMTKVGPSGDASVIEKSQWEAAPTVQRLTLLAQALRGAGQNEFTRGQLEEIRKRLDTRRKQHMFIVAGCEWAVDVRQIRVRKQD